MKDLTFVVQGKISANTKNCLDSIRHFYPDSTIVLSTWKDEPSTGLQYDFLVENDDPGSIQIGNNSQFNLNRQIVSTRNGLKIVKTPYAVKMRTDTQILDSKIPELLDRMVPAKLFKNKIIGLNLFFRDPRKINLLFHIGDIFLVGNTADLYDLWDIPLMPQSEMRNWTAGRFHLYNELRHYTVRYAAEQYIFIAFLAKYQIDASLQYCCEVGLDKACLSEDLIASNFQIYTVEELGINIPSRLLINMRSQDVYEKATLENFSPEKTRQELRGMIRRRKWRLFRQFIKMPRLWFDFLKNQFHKSV